MSETMVQGVYFEKPGRGNTERTLQIAKTRAEELGIRTILVATTSGATGVRAAEEFRGFIVYHKSGIELFGVIRATKHYMSLSSPLALCLVSHKSAREEEGTLWNLEAIWG